MPNATADPNVAQPAAASAPSTTPPKSTPLEMARRNVSASRHATLATVNAPP